MSENYKVDLSGLADWTPYEGLGGQDLLAKDGLYAVKVTKVVAGKTKDGSKQQLTVASVVIDEDEKGKQMITNVMCSGVDRNGKPMIRQLGDFLSSIGATTEQIRGLSSKGAVAVEAIIGRALNKTAFAQVEAETYEGVMSSKVRNWTNKQRYDEAVAANTHRKPRKADVSFSSPSGVSAGSGPLNLGGPAATKPNPAGATAQNPAQALAGLGLLGL